MEKRKFKKSILLGLLPLCLAGDSYGVIAGERGEGRVSSRSPVTAYLEDDPVGLRGADYSGADTSESEWEDKNPGQLKEGIFGPMIKRKFRRGKAGKGQIPSSTVDSDFEDSDTEKKFSPSRKVDTINIDEATVEAFNEHVNEVAARINKRKWGNSVRGQQAKYQAFLKELTESEFSNPEIEDLKTLSQKERLILEELGLASETDSELEEVSQLKKQLTQSSKEAFEKDATKILEEFGRLSQTKGRDSALVRADESGAEEIPSSSGVSSRRLQSLDKGTLEALKEHIRRVTKEVSDLNWFSSPKEQQNKFDTLVARLRMTSKMHLLTHH